MPTWIGVTTQIHIMPHVNHEPHNLVSLTCTRATMSSQTYAPTELLYEIITRTWESPLTPDERVQLMKSSRLASKRWSAVYEDISSEDVHVPCESFYHYFFGDDRRDFTKCKRITFTVYYPKYMHTIGPPSACTLSYMRHTNMTKLTALDWMIIVYHNTTFPDPYVQGFFLALPRYLPRLSILYTFTPEVPRSAINYHRRHFERQSTVRYANPAIGTLEVNGADEYIAAIWESLFPERGRMFRDGKEEKGPLMRVTNYHDPDYALLVRLLDIHRQQEQNAQRRQEKSAYGRSTNFVHVNTDSVSFLTTKTSHDNLTAPSFLTSALPGDLGYIEKSTGIFVPLFNALEPCQVDRITIPSLLGYGDAIIKNGKSHGVSLTDHTKEIKVQGGLAALSNTIGKKLGGWKWRWPERRFKFIEGSIVERWFVANMEKVIRIYGNCVGVSEDDLVIVTGITA
ncbi:hypothetical protein AX15_003308 [Amanita polypyramis BW_CC]|nr:hypothetical protein AX15_003308 [Amanita polypyramis BW_CC]